MSIPIKQRVASAALMLSASALIGLAVSEGYRGDAYVPVKGDKITIGFGSTQDETGNPIRTGERVDPVRGLILLKRDAAEAERIVRRCAPVPMYQHEFDAFVSLAYNIGEGAFCKSTLARKLNAGDYAGACREIEKWVYFKGKTLPGLVKRRADERARCEGRV